eukprot:gene5855-6096_t
MAAPSARQAALVIGWAELEQLLLQYLPPDTVQWECIAASYTDRPAVNEVTLQVLKPAPEQPSDPENGEDESGQQQQQKWSQHAAGTEQLKGSPGQPAAANAASDDLFISPFKLISGSKTAAASSTAASPRSQANSAEAGQTESGDDAAARVRAGQQTRLQAAGSLNWQPVAAGESSNGNNNSSNHMQFHTMQVHASLLVATDGALSVIRQQCVGDGLPAYDGTMRWAGRMPGDLLSTIPVSCEAWWLASGSTFNSHPLSCGDVAWEAQVSSSKLAASGLEWDEAQQCVVRSNSNSPAGRHDAAAAAPAGAEDDDDDDDHNGFSGTAAHVSSTAGPDKMVCDAAVLSMIAATSPSAILESSVHTRPVRLLPPCLGQGSLAILGEAAHPLRPTGQDVSQAFEDAAVLGAAVMMCGPSREALRHFEVNRRARWRHVMQVSQALGSCSNLGGVSLHQGLLDYTTELYRTSFAPLKSVAIQKRPLTRRLLRLAGATLLLYGAAAGLTAALPEEQRRKWHVANTIRWGRHNVGGDRGGMEQLGKVLESTGDVVGQAVSGAAAAAVHVPSRGVGFLGEQLKKVVHVGAKAERGVEGGLSRAAQAVAEVAEETAGSTVVHGVVPSSDGAGKGRLGRFKDAVLGRTLAAGAVVSRPFTRLIRHRVVHDVATHLGAF